MNILKVTFCCRAYWWKCFATVNIWCTWDKTYGYILFI